MSDEELTKYLANVVYNELMKLNNRRREAKGAMVHANDRLREAQENAAKADIEYTLIHDLFDALLSRLYTLDHSRWCDMRAFLKGELEKKRNVVEKPEADSNS